MKGKSSTSRVMLAAILLLALPLAAWGQPQVSIKMKAEKEVTVSVNGKQIKKRIPAKGVQPGEEVIYTLSYVNAGNEPAKDLVISDPLPAGTSYVPGSATDSGDLTFSIDKGKSYKKPTLLSYEIKGSDGKTVRRSATPDDYTNIRWTLPTVAPGGKGSVSFKVKVNR